MQEIRRLPPCWKTKYIFLDSFDVQTKISRHASCGEGVVKLVKRVKMQINTKHSRESVPV